MWNFYPRSPCGERLTYMLYDTSALIFLSTLSLRRATFVGVAESADTGDISIHALLAESDTWQRGSRITYVEFLSTLSLRRATAPQGSRKVFCKISIHALLAESDIGTLRTVSVRKTFLSTLSLRRATIEHLLIIYDTTISIHALLAESDSEHCER